LPAAAPHGANSSCFVEEARENPLGYFLAAYFSLLASLDPDQNSEAQTRDAIQYAAHQCYRAGEFLAMPNTVVELLDMVDGDLYHDVRPQAFSVGPMLATLSGLGLRRLPFGLAVRANQTVSHLSNYEFGASQIDVHFVGEGEISEIRVNGQVLQSTLQLPESVLQKGHNTVEVQMSAIESVQARPIWVESSARMLDVTHEENTTTYQFETLVSDNFIAFRSLPQNQLMLTDSNGAAIEYSRVEAEGRSWIYFSSKGRLVLRIG
jgi:hypothetical protein